MLPTPSRRQSGTDYPSCGVSENTTKGCDVVSPHGEEKELEASTVNKECPVPVTPLIPKDEYPDGGLRAWLVVFGAACSTFSTFGYVNSWGVFQSYYSEELLRDQSPSSIAWIGSMQYALVFIPALPIGRLFDVGYHKLPMLFASILLVASTLVIAHCKEYWHFVLVQGLLVGVACGCLFGAVSPCVAHYFMRRRGNAMGLVAFGSSVGGTAFPIMTRHLITAVGFPWTMRIIAFLLIITTGIPLLTMRRRLPPVITPGGMFTLTAFKYTPYSIYSSCAFVSFLGLYTVLTFIDISAVSWGVSPDYSFYLVAIANGASGFGRVIGGLISDKVGAGNVMIPSNFVCAILTFAWPFARTKASLTVIAVIYGFGVGSYVSLNAVPIIAMGEIGDAGRRIGMFMTILSAGALIGPPISGAINDRTGGYEAVGYYAGSMILAGMGLMMLSRHLVLGGWKGKF